jgi:hypothetical protein
MDAMQVAIPVPNNPGPKVSAPAAAKDWNAIVPPQPGVVSPEPIYADALDHVSERLPKFAADAVWGAVKLVNKVAFRSGPPNGPVAETPGSWKFAAIGDYGSGASPQDEIANNVAKGKPELILTLGDNVYYNGTEAEFQKKWDPDTAFGSLRKNFPVRPSLGNHDVRREPDGVPYFKRFPELDNARFYSFDEKGVHFVAINSNESLAPGSPQYKWLERDLAKSAKDWQVLYFHHPIASSQPHGESPNKGYLAPLMAKYGVDLVLSGHEHNYQRSVPLNEGGTIEVVAGGGGKSLHPFAWKQPAHNAYRDVDFGHVEVEVTGDKLVGRYVVRDGSVRDTWVIPNNTPYHPPAAEASETTPQETHA